MDIRAVIKFEVFSSVGYNGRGFPPLWDTAQEISTVGYISAVGYNGRGFLSCGIPHKTISIRFLVNFLLLYPTKQNFFSIVSHTGTVFFRCIPQGGILPDYYAVHYS
jgi:hypothetical protein